jgi:hypothetical protein
MCLPTLSKWGFKISRATLNYSIYSRVVTCGRLGLNSILLNTVRDTDINVLEWPNSLPSTLLANFRHMAEFVAHSTAGIPIKISRNVIDLERGKYRLNTTAVTVQKGRRERMRKMLYAPFA